MTDLTTTIAPKSDQLNSDDLIGRTMTIRVSRVSLLGEPDQPVAINFEGDGGKPYKPCKSMRRVLVHCWGGDGNTYAGRRMTLYRDPGVKFGGFEVGGIRISHLSHIQKPVTMALTATRAARKPYTVQPLPDEEPQQQVDEGRIKAGAVAMIEALEGEDADGIAALIATPEFKKRRDWFSKNRADLSEQVEAAITKALARTTSNAEGDGWPGPDVGGE